MVNNLTGLFASVVRGGGDDDSDDELVRDACLVCSTSLVDSDLYDRFRVCSVCRFHYSMTARERIQSLVDTESFREINRSVTSLDPLSFSSRESYKQRIFRDQRRTGLTEAVVTGTCSIGGNPAMKRTKGQGWWGR